MGTGTSEARERIGGGRIPFEFAEAQSMRSSHEIDSRADFFWKRAVEVRARAGTLTSAESKEALLKTADEYERIAEELTRAALHGERDNHRLTTH
jgi:hypothetical protein